MCLRVCLPGVPRACVPLGVPLCLSCVPLCPSSAYLYVCFVCTLVFVFCVLLSLPACLRSVALCSPPLCTFVPRLPCAPLWPPPLSLCAPVPASRRGLSQGLITATAAASASSRGNLMARHAVIDSLPGGENKTNSTKIANFYSAEKRKERKSERKDCPISSDALDSGSELILLP